LRSTPDANFTAVDCLKCSTHLADLRSDQFEQEFSGQL